MIDYSKMLNIIVSGAKYAMQLISLQLFCIIIFLVGFGITLPLAIFISFVCVNQILNEGTYSVIYSIKKYWKQELIVFILFYAFVYEVFVYINFIWFSNQTGYLFLAILFFVILTTYIYVFLNYFIFLTLKDYSIFKALKFSLFAFFLDIGTYFKLVFLLIVMLVILFNMPVLIFLFGTNILFLMNNIVLENTYSKLLEKGKKYEEKESVS